MHGLCCAHCWHLIPASIRADLESPAVIGCGDAIRAARAAATAALAAIRYATPGEKRQHEAKLARWRRWRAHRVAAIQSAQAAGPHLGAGGQSPTSDCDRDAV